MIAREEARHAPPAKSAGALEDAAWVSVETSLTVEEARAFVRDIERLLRINPLLEFDAFAPKKQLGVSGIFHASLRNLSNGWQGELELTVRDRGNGIEIAYDKGLKSATRVAVESATDGARIILTDVYDRGSEAERRARLDEVDHSLNAWGRALHDYLRRWARWRWLAPWRWYMRSVWQPMKPSARRIVFLLWLVALVDLAALFLLGLVWFLLLRGLP